MHSYSLRQTMHDGEGTAPSHASRDCAGQVVCRRRLSGLTGGPVVRRRYRRCSLEEVLLPDADKLWDPTSGRATCFSMTMSSSIEWRRPLRPWPSAEPASDVIPANSGGPGGSGCPSQVGDGSAE